ncbi:carbonic anhydrase 12-like [Sparus aurata]|uniref:Carbonic anhydrase n=1 Tax=Sparus aurata TaxID=8175 RepID=A0A671YGX4_SPAAU|nr:carbonic anhydrase 12-like [Sparus aurata]
MKWLVAALAAVCVLAPSAHCADDTIAWCYHDPTCNDTTWPTIAAPFCNGTRQSPINIDTSAATGNSALGPFTFHNFNSTTAMTKIENTGKTIKVALSNVNVSGGDLSETYQSLQFHLHWGNGSSVPGSEHTVDGKRYPMELHIVNLRASFNGDTSLGIANSTGLAALGFFIEADDATSSASWQSLTSYLDNITLSGQSVAIAPGFSLDDLLTGVDREKYWRYLGSLTTPACNEAVVWTVFKDTVKVPSSLINMFSTKLHIFNTTSSPMMVNVFRNIQPNQAVTTQAASSTSKTCYSLGLLALSLALGRS